MINDPLSHQNPQALFKGCTTSLVIMGHYNSIPFSSKTHTSTKYLASSDGIGRSYCLAPLRLTDKRRESAQPRQPSWLHKIQRGLYSEQGKHVILSSATAYPSAHLVHLSYYIYIMIGIPKFYG